MANEEAIKQELISKLGIPEDKVIIQRERRVFADVPAEKFRGLLNYVMDTMKFDILCTITGTDDGANFGVLYHMAHMDGRMLNLRIMTPRDNPVIQTVTDRFPSAEMYERELWDLLGIKIEGLHEGKRYPLPDDWPLGEHPLRKDWKTPSIKTPDQEEKKNG
jgi:membrane-bound hydrogenase subunit beta